MNNYEYLPIDQAKPGDIVERISTQPGANLAIGTLSIIKSINNSEKLTLIDDSGYRFTKHFKLVKTKPGSEAIKGDKVIFTSEYTVASGYKTPIGTIGKCEDTPGNTHIGTRIKTNLYITPPHTSVRVLCKPTTNHDDSIDAVTYTSTIAHTEPKEPTMNSAHTSSLQDILIAAFGAAIPTTDYENRSKLIVIVYSKNGSEIATATADSLDQIITEVQANTRLWGCKVLTYKLHKEVATQVPISVTKAS